MSRHVHLLPRGRPLSDDPGSLQAAVPPLVQAVDAHRLVAVLDDELLVWLVAVGTQAAPSEQVGGFRRLRVAAARTAGSFSAVLGVPSELAIVERLELMVPGVLRGGDPCVA